jgi:hypothetical protein
MMSVSYGKKDRTRKICRVDGNENQQGSETDSECYHVERLEPDGIHCVDSKGNGNAPGVISGGR